VPFKKIGGAFYSTVIAVVQIKVMIVGGLMLAKVVGYSGITQDFIDWIIVNNLPIAMIWVMLIILWIILGMVIDSTSQMVLTVPFVYPVMTGLGVDPVALGIVAVIMVEVGVITPPVGFNCYVVASMADVDPWVVFKGILPFFFVFLVAAVILIKFPIICLYLPTLAFGG